MSRKAISVRVLKRVVKDVGDVFTTKDVSEDPRVMNAHRKLVKHSQYHAFVGGALSDHRDALGIKEIQLPATMSAPTAKMSILSIMAHNLNYD